jgi:Phage gp6-like head-tail connector protein
MLTVIEESTDRNLTRLDTVKTELGITHGKSDEKLEDLIAQASDVVARYCNRVFALETVVETFRTDPHGTQGFTLSRYPVVDIFSINENGTTLDADDYEADLESGIVERLQSDRVLRWPAGKTVITYSSGYDLPDGLPEDIERATIELVKQYYASGDRDPLVRSEVVEGAGSTDYFASPNTGFTPEVEGLLEPHRKPNG